VQISRSASLMEHNYRTLIFFNYLLELFYCIYFIIVIIELKISHALTEGQSHGLQIPWSAHLVEFTYFI
jgi:hypothetical protein